MFLSIGEFPSTVEFGNAATRVPELLLLAVVPAKLLNQLVAFFIRRQLDAMEPGLHS